MLLSTGVFIACNIACSFTKKLACLQDRGDGIPTNLHNTMDEKLEIVKKSRSLDYPGKDCFSISPNQEILRQFHDMSFSEDLVPRLVKLKLKGALKMALEQRNYFKGEFAVVNLK